MPRRARNVVALLTWLLAAGPVAAQTAGDTAAGARVDEIVRAEMVDRKLPSVVVGVTRDGVLVKVAAYGRMKLSPAKNATPHTRYRLDSMTKQFTASGIMLLVEDGRVALDAPVKRYLPAAPSTWDAITVRHLLNHTSGLARDPPSGYPTVAEQNREPAPMLRRLFAMDPVFKPGSRYAYSNAGYETLAAIIHRVTGQPYFRFMHARIYKPAGMTSTALDLARPEASRAAGYVRGTSDLVEAAPGRGLGAGALVSTVFDLARWDAALLGDRILSERSKHEMWSPAKLTTGRSRPYGFGWAMRTIGTDRVVFHNGSGSGFNNAFYRYLNARLGVIVLTNLNPEPGEPSHADALARMITPLYEPSLLWPDRPTLPLKPAEAPNAGKKKD
jgi:CubicO group peptidase (beta-lactamase class C family)